MTATRALLGPTDVSNMVDLSGGKRKLYRKQVLRKGSIQYKGQQINFDDAYLDDLVKSFKDLAYDQVPFQLATADNKHNELPERYAGEVVGLEKTGEGLDALVELSDDAAALIQRNPKLGVSARIVEGLAHSDGRAYPRAMRHVLGTLDPRVTKMAPWREEVSLSNEVEDTWDLTAEKVTDLKDMGEGAKPTPPVQTGNGIVGEKPKVVELTAEEEAAVTAAVAEVLKEVEMSNEAGDGQESEENKTLDLVRAQNEAHLSRIEQLELTLAKERFDREATSLVRDGVPPAIVELARPLLSLPQAPVIDLSNDGSKTVDVGDVVRKMLDQCKGYVELSAERGSFGGAESPEDEASALLSAWDKQN
jgi:hypothetical protein